MSNEQTQAVPTVGFLVMAFTDEHAADDALKAMKDAKKHKQTYFEDAAVIRQDASGKVHYKETGDMSTGRGAGAGALIGGILGILGGPAGVALGAGAGAAIGAAAAHGDAGFRDENLETIGVALKPGTSALATITSDSFLKALQEQVSQEEMQQAVDNLAAEISRLLDEGKSMAFGLILSEDGLAVKEVAVDEQSAEIVGAVITSDAIVVGAAVITDEGVAYEIGMATDEGVALEAGVITEDGSFIVDDVITAEGELIAVTETVPVTVTTAAVVSAEQDAEAPAETDEDEDSAAEVAA